MTMTPQAAGQAAWAPRPIGWAAGSAEGGYCSARVYRAAGILAARRRSRHRGRAGRVHEYAAGRRVSGQQRF